MVHVNGNRHVAQEHEAVTTPLLPGFTLSVKDLLEAPV